MNKSIAIALICGLAASVNVDQTPARSSWEHRWNHREDGQVCFRRGRATANDSESEIETANFCHVILNEWKVELDGEM
jgi:hypothetical protein